MTTVSTDPIADMLSRIRNAVAVNKHEVSVPHSKIKQSVAEILKQTTFIDDVAVKEDGVGKILTMKITDEGSNARITKIDRMSRPGRRHYVGVDDIPTVRRGRGIVIVSTSKGLMTGDKAKKQGLGGELICKVY
jgi:small subunit ribosomal protein S8